MSTRGTLRIYLGAARGVGKTYAMLDEGRRRKLEPEPSRPRHLITEPGMGQRFHRP